MCHSFWLDNKSNENSQTLACCDVLVYSRTTNRMSVIVPFYRTHAIHSGLVPMHREVFKKGFFLFFIYFIYFIFKCWRQPSQHPLVVLRVLWTCDCTTAGQVVTLWSVIISYYIMCLEFHFRLLYSWCRVNTYSYAFMFDMIFNINVILEVLDVTFYDKLWPWTGTDLDFLKKENAFTVSFF